MRDAPRLGLVAAPLPLVATYVQPLTGVRVFLILIDAEAILKNGIALTDVKTFVGSDSGAKFVQTLAIRSLFGPLGASCFVPWGWYFIPLYYRPSPLNEKPPSLRWMHLLHVPYVAAERGRVLGGAAGTRVPLCGNSPWTRPLDGVEHHPRGDARSR